MRGAQEEGWGNPSSPHAAGRRAKRLLEDAREAILALVGGRLRNGDRLVFTSGATEANRTAIMGRAAAPAAIAWSARDHASIAHAAAAVGSAGWTSYRMPLEHTGRIDPAWTWPAPPPAGSVLATTLICGQTGVIEDMGHATGLAAAPGVFLHCDATQAVPTCPVSMATLGAATVAFAPHKFGGPRGIGALVCRSDVRLAALVPGTQEAGMRGGTEPVLLAVGFARAFELAVAERDATATRLAAVAGRFTAAFVAAAAAAGLEALPLGDPIGRAPQIVTIALTGVDRQAFVMAADVAGVCCATGTACASGSSEPAAVLEAMGLLGRDLFVDTPLARMFAP